VLCIGLGTWFLYEHRRLGPAVLGARYLELRRTLTSLALGCLVIALIALG
jgi:hypothetical protein